MAVQSIDILRDDASEFARVFQTHDRSMHRIRPRIAKSISAFQLIIPMLDAGRFRGHEILEVNRLPACPNAVWAAKVRYPAPGRDASPGENDRTSGSPNVI